MAEEGQSMFDKAKDAAKDMADKVGDAAEGVKDKVGDLVGKHEDKIDSGIEKGGDFVDDKTGGRFSEKIDSAQDAAHGAVDKMTDEEEPEPEQPGNAPL